MIQGIEDRLTSALTKQTEKVKYFGHAKNISPNLAVHEVRKSFKRIRAILGFYKDTENELPDQAAHQFVLFGKKLSPFRNMWVNLQILEKMTKENLHISERKLKALKDKLTEKYKDFLEMELEGEQLIAEVLRYIQEFETMHKERFSSPENEKIVEQLTGIFRKGYSIYMNPDLFNDAGIRHELRKKLKVLYYQTDFLRFYHARFFKMKSDQLHAITEHLGDDHDLFVFYEEISKDEYELTRLEKEVIKNKVEYLRDMNLLKCQTRLKQFFSETPEIFSQKTKQILLPG